MNLEDIPLATGVLLKNLLDEAGMNTIDLAASVMWKPNPDGLKILISLCRKDLACRLASVHGIDMSSDDGDELTAMADFATLSVAVQHWIHRAHRLLCDPFWRRYGERVLEFLRSEVGNETYEKLVELHMSDVSDEQIAEAHGIMTMCEEKNKLHEEMDLYLLHEGLLYMFFDPLCYHVAREIVFFEKLEDRFRSTPGWEIGWTLGRTSNERDTEH